MGHARSAAALLAAASVSAALAACSSDHRETLRWEVLANQGNELTIRAMHGACDNGPHARSTETARTVTVRVTTAARSGACQASAKLTVLTINLKQPLGTRALAGCSTGPTDCTKYALK